MNKNIIDVLINKGYITTFVDASKYESIDDLINRGIITNPGVKSKIESLLESLEISHKDEPIIIDTPEDIVPIDETPISEEVIIDTPVEETPIDETPVEEPTVVETVEVVEEVKPKKTRTKKTE